MKEINIRFLKEHGQRWKGDYITKNEYKRMAEAWKNSISKVKISNELTCEDILKR